MISSFTTRANHLSAALGQVGLPLRAEIEATIKSDEFKNLAASPVLAMAGLMIGARISTKVYEKTLTPEQRFKRQRRKLISHAKHPTRSRFSRSAHHRRAAWL